MSWEWRYLHRCNVYFPCKGMCCCFFKGEINFRCDLFVCCVRIASDLFGMCRLWCCGEALPAHPNKHPITPSDTRRTLLLSGRIPFVRVTLSVCVRFWWMRLCAGTLTILMPSLMALCWGRGGGGGGSSVTSGCSMTTAATTSMLWQRGAFGGGYPPKWMTASPSVLLPWLLRGGPHGFTHPKEWISIYYIHDGIHIIDS